VLLGNLLLSCLFEGVLLEDFGEDTLVAAEEGAIDRTYVLLFVVKEINGVF